MDEQRRAPIESQWVGRLLMSLIGAVVLWGFVTATRDPETDRVFSNVSLTIENLAPGLVIVSDVESTEVKVTGPKSVIGGLVSTQIEGLVDLGDVAEPGTYSVRIQVPKPDDVWSIGATPRSISLLIERETTRTFPIEPQYAGNLGSNQQVESFDPSASEVAITGPASLVDRIARVILPVDIGDRTSDFAGVFTPEPVDANGEIIAGTTVSPSSISASIEITARGKQIAVIPQVSGSPSSGFEVVDRWTIPDTVLVDGPAEILDDLITVNTDVVDISGATEDISRRVNLVDLPAGVTLLEPQSGQVDVVVQIRQRGVQQPLPSQQVTIVNLGEGLTAIASPNTVLVTVIGGEQELEQLSPTSLIVQIDVAGLEPGTYELVPTVILPQNMEWTSIDPALVTVVIERDTEVTTAGTPVGSPEATPEI